MTASELSPIAAFDIRADGSATKIDEPWPAPRPRPGFDWRWLHLELSDPELATWLEAHMPIVAADAMQQTETRPRCTVLHDGLLVNFRGVNMNPGAEVEDMVSLRLWMTAELVVTVRMRRVFSVDDLRRATEAGNAAPSPGDFVASLAEALTDRLESVSLALDDEADALEEAILEEENEAAGDDVAPLRRKALRLRRFTGPQREALLRLADGPGGLIGREAQGLLGESANRTTRAVEELESVSARLTALNDHLYNQQGTRMARNGFVLSVVASVFLPLGFLTGLFGVNVAGMPGTSWPWAFAVLALANVALAIFLIFLFRALKWF